MKRVWT